MVRENGVIAAMAVHVAGRAFLLDIAQLTVGRQLPIAADDAPACERSKSEEPDQTHGDAIPPCVPVGSKPYAAQLHRVAAFLDRAGSPFLQDFLPFVVRMPEPQ